MKSMKTFLFACLGLAGSVVAADLARAQALVLNGAGSSAGRQFAALIPTDLQLCDAGSTPTVFQSHENPPNRTEWQCTVGGQQRTYRYSASASADGYLKLPNGVAGTANYLSLTGCPAPAPVANYKGTGRTVNVATCGTSQNPQPSQSLTVHYGASDVKPTSFNVTANGQTLSPPPAGHLTANPIVSVPFSIVVGKDVRGGGGGQLMNLTQAEVRQILAGEVTNWPTLGHETATATKTITVCQRTVPSGTLATLMQTVMQSPGWFSGINPNPSATNIFNASSSDVKACVETNANSIGYIDDDTVPNLLPGGGFPTSPYQVALDGFLPSNPALADGTFGVGKTRDVRCGKYIYWADWVIVTRNGGIEANPIGAPQGSNALLTLFQNRATAINPLKQFWADQNNTFVFKNEDKGPHNWFTPNGNNVSAATECSNAGSIQ